MNTERNKALQSAANRVSKYLDEYSKMSRLDPEEIASLHVGDERQAILSYSDLRVLLEAAALASPVAQPQDELTPLDYRAQGREEALAIILEQEAEEALADCTRSSAIADTGDYSTSWDEDKLRELLNIGDRKHDAFGRAEEAYWEAQCHKYDAELAMRMVERAPYFQRLHDVLAKHQEWDLLGDLQAARATPSQDAAWISFEAQQPEEGQQVISAFHPYNKPEYAHIVCDATYMHGEFIDYDGDEVYTPTHWIPRPDFAAMQAQGAKE